MVVVTLKPDEMYPAQFGEDRELEQRFAGRTGYFLEIGAGDGRLGSNTYRLEQIGWKGLLVEANPDLIQDCILARPESRVVNRAAIAPGAPSTVTFQVALDNSGLSALEITAEGRGMLGSWTGQVRIKEITIAAQTLDEILEEDPPERVHVATIDVEGHEAAVLSGFDLRRWSPEVLIIERNRRLPDRAVMRQLRRSEYVYERTTGVNDWFVPGRANLRYRLQLAFGYYLPKLIGGVGSRLGRLAPPRTATFTD